MEVIFTGISGDRKHDVKLNVPVPVKEVLTAITLKVRKRSIFNISPDNLGQYIYYLTETKEEEVVFRGQFFGDAFISTHNQFCRNMLFSSR